MEMTEFKCKCLLIFFNPVTLVLVTLFVCSRCETCYQPCSDAKLPEPYLEIKELGTIKTNNEVCRIEEVSLVKYRLAPASASHGDYEVDRKNRCIGPTKLPPKPVVRRMVCPSGQNGTSKIGDDGTKFHRETLE